MSDAQQIKDLMVVLFWLQLLANIALSWTLIDHHISVLEKKLNEKENESGLD